MRRAARARASQRLARAARIFIRLQPNRQKVHKNCRIYLRKFIIEKAKKPIAATEAAAVALFKGAVNPSATDIPD